MWGGGCGRGPGSGCSAVSLRVWGPRVGQLAAKPLSSLGPVGTVCKRPRAGPQESPQPPSPLQTHLGSQRTCLCGGVHLVCSWSASSGPSGCARAARAVWTQHGAFVGELSGGLRAACPVCEGKCAVHVHAVAQTALPVLPPASLREGLEGITMAPRAAEPAGPRPGGGQRCPLTPPPLCSRVLPRELPGLRCLPAAQDDSHLAHHPQEVRHPLQPGTWGLLEGGSWAREPQCSRTLASSPWRRFWNSGKLGERHMCWAVGLQLFCGGGEVERGQPGGLIPPGPRPKPTPSLYPMWGRAGAGAPADFPGSC